MNTQKGSSSVLVTVLAVVAIVAVGYALYAQYLTPSAPAESVAVPVHLSDTETPSSQSEGARTHLVTGVYRFSDMHEIPYMFVLSRGTQLMNSTGIIFRDNDAAMQLLGLTEEKFLPFSDPCPATVTATVLISNLKQFKREQPVSGMSPHTYPYVIADLDSVTEVGTPGHTCTP